MPLRVAFLAAECEPWAKTGGLGDVVDALARALGRRADGGRATPPSTSSCRAIAASRCRPLRARPPCSGSRTRAPTGHDRASVIDLEADGYRLRLVDHPAAFDRDGPYGDRPATSPDNAWRFGLFCRAALEALRAEGAPGRRPPPPRLARGSGRALPRRLLGRRPDHRERGDPPEDPQPRVSRLDAPGVPRQLGLGPGGGIGARMPTASTSCGSASPRGAREHGQPGLRGRGADAGVRDGPRRPLRAEGRPLHRHPQRPRHDALGPGERPGPGRAVLARRPAGKAACRADLLTRLGFDPADAAPVLGMIGRLDPQKGFDLLAGAAPALLEAGARIVVQGSGHPALADPFRGWSRRARTASRSSSASTGTWRAASTRAPTSSSCRRGSSRAARAR